MHSHKSNIFELFNKNKNNETSNKNIFYFIIYTTSVIHILYILYIYIYIYIYTYTGRLNECCPAQHGTPAGNMGNQPPGGQTQHWIRAAAPNNETDATELTNIHRSTNTTLESLAYVSEGGLCYWFGIPKEIYKICKI